MHNLESALEIETHKLRWDFEIQANQQISARRPDLVIVKWKMRNYGIVDFAVPVDRIVKLKESKKRDQYQDLAREVKKTLEYEIDGDTNCNLFARYSHKRIIKGIGGIGTTRTSGDHQNYNITKIGENSEKGLRRRLAISLTPEEDHQLTLLLKTPKGVKQ